MTIYYTGFEPDERERFAEYALEVANAQENAFGITFECSECTPKNWTVGISTGLSTQDPEVDKEYRQKLRDLFQHVAYRHPASSHARINMRVNRPFATITR